jgi:ribonuclease BN (tRNA processing enzyme)
MSEEFDFRVLDESGPAEVGPLRIEAARVVHPIDAFGFRVSQGARSLVYSGDTGPSTALVDLARGSDLLLSEASFLEREANPPGLHLTGREAAQAATKAGVGRLVLTHSPPWYDPLEAYDDARPAYDGPLALARPGADYDI